jgi:drug/metabolite transporter (DMT)-like permease
MIAYVELALVPVAGAMGNIAQTIAAMRADRRANLDLTLLRRLIKDRIYLLGFTSQVVGFGLAFLARGTLPLYLVQAASCASIGLTAVTGSLVLGWRITIREALAVVGLALGVVLLVGAAKPSTAASLSTGELLVGVGALVAIGALGMLAARIPGPRAAVALGGLAGLAFGGLAVLSRPLASGPLLDMPQSPSFWLMVVFALLGQTLFATALQRGSTTLTVAMMEATGVLVAAAIGLAALNDQVTAGRELWIPVGLALVVVSVIAVAAVVGPKADHATAIREVEEDPVPGGEAPWQR